MSAPMILGVTGRKRSGKDTLAATLVNDLGFTRFAFADALKGVVLDIDPLVETSVNDGPLGLINMRLSKIVHDFGWETAKETPEIRRLLQATGQAVRAVDPAFWTRIVADPVASHVASGRGPVVVTDVRFPNEADALTSLGARIVRVTRPDLTMGTSATDMDVSETAMNDYPVHGEIVNDGTLADLALKAHYLVERASAA